MVGVKNQIHSCFDAKFYFSLMFYEYYLYYILPKIGFRGVEKMADMAAWRKSIAECGTENGWANAWKADPQVI